MSSTDKMAAPELGGVEIHGMSRSAFILRGAVVTGGLYGAGAVGSFVSQAFAQGGGGDVDILNFALTLEYLEAAFYKEALAKVKLPADLKKLATEIGGHEQQHVATLTQTITQLGGKPVASPKVAFPLNGVASFRKLAQTFEDTGVSAYNGAAPMIQSKDVLGAAGSIVQVEARHAAAIRLSNGNAPSPAAFDKTLSKAQVLVAVKPFIKG
ncbi:MAG: ferritin-like domain-containing protein [Thermoleophilaceae bacterium]